MKEKCNCIGGCAKPILNEQVMKCQDDVMKREMNNQEWLNEQNVQPIQDRKDGKDYYKTDNLYTETDVLKFLDVRLAEAKEENAKLKEVLKESKDVLSNVYYWETCAEDCKKRIEALTQEKGEEK